MAPVQEKACTISLEPEIVHASRVAQPGSRLIVKAESESELQLVGVYVVVKPLVAGAEVREAVFGRYSDVAMKHDGHPGADFHARVGARIAAERTKFKMLK